MRSWASVMVKGRSMFMLLRYEIECGLMLRVSLIQCLALFNWPLVVIAFMFKEKVMQW